MSSQFIMKAYCPADRGIVSTVAAFLAEHSCYISEMHQFDDEDTGLFFMRAVCRIDAEDVTQEDIRKNFQPHANALKMHWEIFDANRPTKVLLMVSKYDHCLKELLYRHAKGELHMDITGIVSNHEDLRYIADQEKLPYYFLPVTKETKEAQEQALLNIIDITGTELVVLARYMQILSDNLCRNLKGKAINIHHSFLPGFKGAKPYHQAHMRGVKLIGATAHYVTADLDEGPIISQAVQTVDHSFSPDRLVALGRTTENIALAEAVQLHLEHRVFVDANKTIVFK